MNKRQKEVLQLFIDEEKATLNELKKSYKDALDDINYKLSELMARQDADLQHVIYQIDYQKSLKGQVQSILEELHSNEFETLSKYLTNSYTHGYVGTMYDIAGQGIPLIMPIDQNKVLDAIKNETKLNENLYTSLGHDIKNLQKTISAEISRGISTGLSYTDIARNLKSSANIPMNRAMTIARTEAHRIQCKATSDAQEVAKSKGADVLKQWDASLDGATRDTHRQLDGQIRELDELFSVGTKKAKYPGAFGDPAEDCNCRCALLQRARWALDEEELEVLKERAAEHGLDKTDDFAEYEKKFLKVAESERVRLNVPKTKPEDTLKKMGKSGIINIELDEATPCLRRLSDNKLVNTSVVDIIPSKNDFKDWEFDWTIPEKNGYTIRGIKADGDDRIQGMIALKPDAQNYAVAIDIVEAAPFNNPHNKLFKGKEYSGVGKHLFAEAVKESMEQGFDGYVYFKAKTDLIEHYQKELGAVLINPRERIMAIDERSAEKLYDRYYKDK